MRSLQPNLVTARPSPAIASGERPHRARRFWPVARRHPRPDSPGFSGLSLLRPRRCHRWLLGTAIAATLILCGGARALETDILLGGRVVKPNVLLLFDNSGSMNNAPVYDPNQTYSGPYDPTTIYTRCTRYSGNCSCRRKNNTWRVFDGQCGFQDNDNDGVDDRTVYKELGNRRNYESGVPNKIQVAKSVITSLLNNPATDNIRFGLMVYNGNYNLNASNFSSSAFSNYHNDLSILKAPIADDNHSSLLSIVNGLGANGGTPSANRMIAAGNYFAGTFPGYPSPIQYPCQRNYIVNVTDGIPEGEGNSLNANYTGQYPYIEDWLHSKLGSNIDPDGDGNDPDPTTNAYINGGSDYMDDVAWVLQHQDLLSSMDGLQNVTTFTIGFNISHPLLASTAENGGGKYFTATTADELADALRRTINLIVTDAQSFVAPVVPVNALKRTQSGDRLYIALFQPLQTSNFWAGNIKKYGIDANGDLISPSGAPATATDGSLLPESASYYDSTPSGGAVTRGGVGELLVRRSTPRNIYTYLGNADLTAAANAFQPENTAIDKTLLAVADDTERDQVIRYVRGEDVFDDDEDGNETEKRDWILGDFIHSTPLVINYDGNRIIMAAANDGQLHVFDDETGQELWSFVPPAVLPRLKELLPGESANHPFLADGSPKLLSTDDGRLIVVFGLRRGGPYYYAIDVTNKTAPRLLWQVGPDSPGMSELGQAWSDPALGKIGTSSAFQYAAIFGAGFDTAFDSPAQSSPNTASPVGRGLFILDALTGSLIRSIGGLSYPVPSNVSALDSNDDGTLDLVYFGDLGGNMWRLDLPSTLTKVFSAPSGHRIFFAPDLVREQGYLDVLFGTGDLANPLETTTTDRLYAIRDDGLSSGSTEADLVDVTDDLGQQGSAAQKQLVASQLASSKGWYIRLTTPGEKALASPLAFFDIFFTTFLPTEEVCDGGGDAFLYRLSFDDGGATTDVDQSGQLDKSDRSIDIGSSIPTEVTPTIRENDAVGYVGVGGAIPRVNLPGPPLNIVPIYWREIF